MSEQELEQSLEERVMVLEGEVAKLKSATSASSEHQEGDILHTMMGDLAWHNGAWETVVTENDNEWDPGETPKASWAIKYLIPWKEKRQWYGEAKDGRVTPLNVVDGYGYWTAFQKRPADFPTDGRIDNPEFRANYCG